MSRNKRTNATHANKHIHLTQTRMCVSITPLRICQYLPLGHDNSVQTIRAPYFHGRLVWVRVTINYQISSTVEWS